MKTPARTIAPSGTYVPNAPPMRTGSEDFLKCPSVILGRRKEHCVSTKPVKK
jgi:hypothetical protein